MKKFASVCIALIIVFITSAVYATTTFTAKLETDKSVIKAGEELEIVLKLENFTENEKGINVLIATLEYDKGIFEVVSENDISLVQFWNAPIYNSENGKIVMESNDFIDTSHNALKIKLKVKENIEENTTTEIKVKDISASDGEKDIYVEDAVAVIQVEKLTEEEIANNNTNDNKILIMTLAILGIVIVGSVCIVIVKKKM